jgi:hypothetical protein
MEKQTNLEEEQQNRRDSKREKEKRLCDRIPESDFFLTSESPSPARRLPEREEATEKGVKTSLDFFLG